MNPPEAPEPPIPVLHADHGDLKCCGIIMAVERVDGQADLGCSECGVVVITVPGNIAERTLIEMAMAGGVCTEVCTHCGRLNIFPGFKRIKAFVCEYCGRPTHNPGW